VGGEVEGCGDYDGRGEGLRLSCVRLGCVDVMAGGKGKRCSGSERRLGGDEAAHTFVYRYTTWVVDGRCKVLAKIVTTGSVEVVQTVITSTRIRLPDAYLDIIAMPPSQPTYADARDAHSHSPISSECASPNPSHCSSSSPAITYPPPRSCSLCSAATSSPVTPPILSSATLDKSSQSDPKLSR
jgi:hypothetical protein